MALPPARAVGDGDPPADISAIVAYLGDMPGRNRIINGNFRTNQRAYASAGALASGSYGFDRWKSTTASSSMTFTAAPQGQTVTINSGGSFAQIIERANVEADTYVLSWAGTATGRVYNVGGSAPGYAASPVTVSVDGTADLTVEFTASGGTRTLGLVQLEAAADPTPFERTHPALELALCLRYFYRYAPPINERVGVGQCFNATSGELVVPFPVVMRTSPTITATAANASVYTAGASTVTLGALISAAVGPRTVSLQWNGTSSFAAGNAVIMFANSAGGTIFDAAAEL